MPRGGRPLRAVADEALDDAILERMEGHDDEPAARLQHPFRRDQRARELAELVVDVDAQRLERAGGGVDTVLRLAADHLADDPGQIERRLEGLFGPARLDGTGN